MITIIKQVSGIDTDTDRAIVDMTGLSNDTKPTNVGNGSSFVEIDTSRVFMFDETGDRWIEM